jgi:hypothetical protein
MTAFSNIRGIIRIIFEKIRETISQKSFPENSEGLDKTLCGAVGRFMSVWQGVDMDSPKHH